MYIWFCQYMLIWYVNNPEETGYYLRRLQGGWNGTWGRLIIASLVMNWGIPFLVLLPRAMKARVGVLVGISVLVLAGHWLDLYICIMPYFGNPTSAGAVCEIGLLLGAVGVFTLVFFAALGRAALIPVQDPFLQESLPRFREDANGVRRLKDRHALPSIEKLLLLLRLGSHRHRLSGVRPGRLPRVADRQARLGPCAAAVHAAPGSADRG